MSRFKCQVCGRRKWLHKSGSVALHHVAGSICPGTGYLPIEHDDARLIGYTSEVEAELHEVSATLRKLRAARSNWIDPILIERQSSLAENWRKLSRRLERHLAWPDRYQREMERRGWAMPPPEYMMKQDTENSLLSVK